MIKRTRSTNSSTNFYNYIRMHVHIVNQHNTSQLNQYANFIDYICIICSINLCHFVSNESHQNNPEKMTQDCLTLQPWTTFVYLSIIGVASLNQYTSHRYSIATYTFYLITGIFLNIASKPQGWFLSAYTTDVCNNLQGYTWSLSCAMFLGEVMTFATVPLWMQLLWNISGKHYLNFNALVAVHGGISFVFSYHFAEYLKKIDKFNEAGFR